MAESQDSAEIAAAIRELAKQVDALGNAAISAAEIIAKAIRPRDQRPGRPAARFWVSDIWRLLLVPVQAAAATSVRAAPEPLFADR